ncbi:ATP-dependent RNA helicase DeaD [Salmonella enterica subsp. enterica]|uniref:ATP-dependent RNA helicase DeaD n=1 Tax=Salmonella enterica I TaxID=59201 RepID=A0A447TUS0_SALET|nr:ATP-dependent RNA helicase DeaD [Salmonella enterica subsp. enterica]
MVVASAANVGESRGPRRDDSTGRRRFGGDA